MMIRWPSLGALVLFTMLVVATSASAECALVLWQETEVSRLLPSRPEDPAKWARVGASWRIHGAYPTKAACQAKEDFLWPSVRAERKRIVDGGVVTGHVMTDLQCLPDTVDPRGPKGGK